jgi:hypothetical protein
MGGRRKTQMPYRSSAQILLTAQMGTSSVTHSGSKMKEEKEEIEYLILHLFCLFLWTVLKTSLKTPLKTSLSIHSNTMNG